MERESEEKQEQSGPAIKRETTCPVCKHELPAGARYCVACKHDLSWRRHLNIGTTTLALLTALLAVAGSAIDSIKKAVEPNDSKIDVQFLAVATDGVTGSFLVSNTGKRTGALHYAYLTLTSPADDFRITVMFTRDDLLPIYLKPGFSEEVRLTGRRLHITHRGRAVERLTEEMIEDVRGADGSRCEASARVINASGQFTGDDNKTFMGVPASCTMMLHTFHKFVNASEHGPQPKVNGQ